MKPILEWYADLPEPIRSQAIANYNPSFWANKGVAESKGKAISHGFDWDCSPEGFDYWYSINFKAKAGHYNKPAIDYKQTLIEAYRSHDLTVEDFENTLNHFAEIIRGEVKGGIG